MTFAVTLVTLLVAVTECGTEVPYRKRRLIWFNFRGQSSSTRKAQQLELQLADAHTLEGTQRWTGLRQDRATAIKAGPSWPIHQLGLIFQRFYSSHQTAGDRAFKHMSLRGDITDRS